MRCFKVQEYRFQTGKSFGKGFPDYNVWVLVVVLSPPLLKVCTFSSHSPNTSGEKYHLSGRALAGIIELMGFEQGMHSYNLA